MPRPSLATGRKTTTRKSVAEKTADTAPKTTSVAIPSATSQGNTTIISAVPGLVTFAPDAVAKMMPTFTESSYAVTDPLNPPENLPQATESQFNKGMGIYQGATRALQLTGAGFDLTKERFTVISKQAKAFGAGIKAATEFEKVQGDYYDYQNQLETNQQKEVTLGVSQHRTTVEKGQVVHDKTSLDEKLNQSRIDADLAKAKSRSKQSVLDEFLKQLGEIAD
jgi:hypothetical protein